MNRMLQCAVLAVALAMAGPAMADPGHEVRIEDITKEIALNPGRADLYYQRAINYRDMPRLKEAREDFEKALTLEANFLPAQRELAGLDAGEGHVKEAIARLEKAIETPARDAAFHLPACYEVLTGLYLKAGRNEEALKAVEKVFELSTDWSLNAYLQRGEAQRRLGKHEERVRDFEAGWKKVKSFVLRIAWIEALVDAGHTAVALPEINAEIESSRYKSSWLIRRARALLHDGKKTEAAADLEAALAEIEPRIIPQNPEPSLMCDRALIYALQGKRAEARRELNDAKARGAFEWSSRTVEAVLEAAEKKAAEQAGPAKAK